MTNLDTLMATLARTKWPYRTETPPDPPRIRPATPSVPIATLVHVGSVHGQVEFEFDGAGNLLSLWLA